MTLRTGFTWFVLLLRKSAAAEARNSNDGSCKRDDANYLNYVNDDDDQSVDINIKQKYVSLTKLQ